MIECTLVAHKFAFIENVLCYILIFSVMNFVFNNEVLAGFLKGLSGTKPTNSNKEVGE
ncbi:MAG: hypothetical protein DHS20C07_18820 [Methyloligella sp.]|nr:MAG: hypothetical protein DHS20C07_18820 [Methyloligella sp.]